MTALERARTWLAAEGYVPGEGPLSKEQARVVSSLADAMFDAQSDVVIAAEQLLREALRDLRREVTP